MKLIHILLSILGLGILSACKKSGYETKNGSVFFKDYRMRSADYDTFETLNDVFAKDKNQGYYRGIPITGAAGAGFEAFDDHYATDHVSVFFCDNYLDFQLFNTRRKDKINQVSNADAGSFVVFNDKYAKDKSRAYYQGTGFAVNDVASFEPLDYMFAKDRKVGYFFQKPIPNSEGSSFEVLSHNHSKDSRNVYYSWTISDGPATPGIRVIKAADPGSFTVVGLMYYATDENHAYYQGKPLEAADPVSFKKWDEYIIDYSTDSTHVYFEEKLIKEADKASFRLLTDGYAQDNHTIFYGDKFIKNADLLSFTVLKSGYAKDAKRVYYDGKILSGAETGSFALVDNEADRDAADKTHSYHEGQRVKLDD